MTQPPPIVPGPGGPPPQPPYQYPPPRPVVVKGPSTKKILLVVAGCLAGVVGLCVLLGGVLPSLLPDPGRGGGGGDPMTVTLETCTGSSGFYKATVSVTNNSSRARSTVVKVEFIDSTGDRLATGSAFVTDLAPGQTSHEEVVGAGPENSGFRCRLTS